MYLLNFYSFSPNFLPSPTGPNFSYLCLLFDYKLTTVAKLFLWGHYSHLPSASLPLCLSPTDPILEFEPTNSHLVIQSLILLNTLLIPHATIQVLGNTHHLFNNSDIHYLGISPFSLGTGLRTRVI